MKAVILASELGTSPPGKPTIPKSVTTKIHKC